MKVASRAVVDGRAVYACPSCSKTTSTLGAIQLHARKEHDEEVVGPGRPVSRHSVQRGDTIVIGREPEKVHIIVGNGKSEREIITYANTMADMVEIITGALRQKAAK